mgnify:CR=1 FL=1|jgi:hypothetical protein|tara:strand:+ start:366 stop:938 length:573 start_codon:yes stop_codon:yes gene_type:complete
MSMATGERLTILGTLCAAALLMWLSAWPDWQAAETRQAQLLELERKVSGIAQAEESLTIETRRLSEAREQRDRECRRIPPAADVAGLMQALSLEVTGDDVRDQTFTVMDRSSEEAGRFRVLPLRVELAADFSSVWSVLERAEGLSRLVRVSGLEMSLADQEHPTDGAQPLRASLTLDVVYAPPADGDSMP